MNQKKVKQVRRVLRRNQVRLAVASIKQMQKLPWPARVGMAWRLVFKRLG